MTVSISYMSLAYWKTGIIAAQFTTRFAYYSLYKSEHFVTDLFVLSYLIYFLQPNLKKTLSIRYFLAVFRIFHFFNLKFSLFSTNNVDYIILSNVLFVVKNKYTFLLPSIATVLNRLCWTKYKVVSWLTNNCLIRFWQCVSTRHEVLLK